ncbi:hypothetical protein BHU72_13125 [Desulfuribacillus stibiiarsenatis]|uniref:GGDEF domain-containing protein n=1 Tax=Desulfuribacillus stibiiarsenatis TaxID=1390249 RepID=A0A1E5L8S0_9FIRM|nr:diguanylate cyclase [Desulfuribacillus stibiiarsenatis]OEH86545.1 hypothetical protein BHU72_13125 [Desulfuribacillus stibiiarsenatis]
MKNKIKDKKSIVFKLTAFVILLIVIQAVLLTITMIVAGVLSQAKENAYQAFYEKVSNRKNIIQEEMKNRWTNMDPFVSKISRVLSNNTDTQSFFDEAIQDVIAMLRATEVTGAFIILEEDEREENGKAAIYVRDYDPLLNDISNSDLYLVAGPSELAKKLRIPLDQMWGYNLKLDESNRIFYDNPYTNASLTFQTQLLGYLSPPFQMSEDDLPIITYTMPLFDAEKRLRGVIGVEVSVNYVTQFLPATEILSKDSLGYMIGFQGDQSTDIHPIVMTGALQKRMIRNSEPLIFHNVDEERDIYSIENHKSGQPIFACVKAIELYHYNTPFEGEKWYLIGMITESHLLNYVVKIQRILWVSLLVSIVIGAFSGYIVSYYFTKPIIQLAKQVREGDKETALSFQPTGFTEVDELATAIVSANNALLESTIKMSRIIDLVEVPIGAFECRDESNHVFVTDQLQQVLSIDNKKMSRLVQHKELFKNMIEDIFRHPEPDEEGVYNINGYKWVRIKTVSYETSILGVVIDVTEEILQKKVIKQDRDHDPLTNILNRRAAQQGIEELMKMGSELNTAALLMFDLDNLKIINDTFGHKWGDIYIKEAARQLTLIADGRKIVGRRSGDEFVLFLHGYPSRDAIEEVIAQLYRNLEQEPIEYPNGEKKAISISAGLVWIENWEISYDELLQQADEMLYEAKEQAKGTCKY